MFACIGLCGFLSLSPAGAAGLNSLDDAQWDESAVRRVLHVFAYGGHATDQQIKEWAEMALQAAIEQMLTFGAVNAKLSPVSEVQDEPASYADSLQALQTWWSSDDVANLTCPENRGAFDETRVRADGNTVLRNQGLQNTWIQAVNKRGLNPFRHKVGFWLVNYQMAVNLHDTEPPLIRELYDSALDALAQGAPFHEVLAIGATSAAVAREYGHRANTYNNNTGVFRGNDDFAREFHQLFFRINGDIEDPDYHENITIEHTAWALTGMQLDKEPNAYGTTLTQDWWIAPIDFTNHRDGTNRNIRNATRHHWDDLEILHAAIAGATAEDKLFNLAAVAIEHPESLDNLPVGIANFFADDNLTAQKLAAIRATWRTLAGQPEDLLRFLRAYAISTSFHRSDTFQYRTAFNRNMTTYNLNTVDNQEAYGNAFSPRATMNLQGAEVFIPVHDVFGGQTSLNAANNPNLFKEAYNVSVDFPNRIAKTFDACRDALGNRLYNWRKDWARVIPATDGVYRVKDVGAWLWQRFISDDGAHYGSLEQAQVTALLATGLDLGYLVDAINPDIAYNALELEAEPVASLVAANEAALMALDSSVTATRREANRRVGMAINFIGMTPFMFATTGALATPPTSVTVPHVLGLEQTVAESAITAAGLTVGTLTNASSDLVPAGEVIAQTPSGGAQVAPGSAVDLLISAGPDTVPVPDVVGFSQSAAQAAVVAAGLFSAVSTANSDSVPAGDVISQSPAPGTSVVPGVTVNLVVSLGPLPNQRPLVTIDAPSDGATFSEGAVIDFGATASDPEDGDLTADLVWTSDLDGQIGTGGAFATTLSLGTHTITVSVTDADGQSDSDAIAITASLPAESDNLQCTKAEYKVEKDRLRVEVKSSDKTGERILTAVIDVDGDGVYERSLGVIPIRSGKLNSCKRDENGFADPNSTPLSRVRVTSDLGGVCSRKVKID